MRRVIEVREEGDLRSVRRPAGRRYRGTVRCVDADRVARLPVDDLEADAAARGHLSRAIRRLVDLQATEPVVGLGVDGHRGHSLALLPQKLRAVRARVVEGHVAVARREHGIHDLGRRAQERLLCEYRIVVLYLRVRDGYRGQQQRRREDGASQASQGSHCVCLRLPGFREPGMGVPTYRSARRPVGRCAT